MEEEGLVFRIFAEGDATVGDGTHEALVVIPYALNWSPDMVRATKEALADAFKTIVDNKRVLVFTAEEYREWIRTED